ncbi:hypothetical protein ACFLYD_05670 [Chloroflexota bacterium]
MSRREVREHLAAHADRLSSPQAARGQAIPRNYQVQALLDLAEQLQGILVPVEANADFRRRLHGELILEGQRRQVASASSPLRQHRKGILIGAAAVGSVASVVGVIIAFVLRQRHGRATHIATG